MSNFQQPNKNDGHLKVNTTRGVYYPSFLKMEVNVLSDLDNLNALEELPYSTFFHEYIHFLQDVSTTFGLVNGTILVNKVKYANEQIRSGGTTFKVPISVTNDQTTELNDQLRKVYLGSQQSERKVKVLTVNEQNTRINLPPPYFKTLTKVLVNYEIDEHSTSSFDLGAIVLMENMAHIAQNKYTKIAHPDLPYRSAELVAKHIYPAIGENEIFVFALCDACLMTLHPGLVFYKALIQMEKENFQPSNEKEVFNHVISNCKAGNTDIMSHFTEVCTKARRHYADYFTTNIYANERRWIDHVLEKAHHLRLSNPYFLIDIIKQPVNPSKPLRDVFNLLGSPLMMNFDQKAWFHPPHKLKGLHIQPDRLAAILEIFNLLEYGEKKCELKNYCQSTPTLDFTDNRCDLTPWLRANDSQLCAYGALWKTWGLTGYSPK